VCFSGEVQDMLYNISLVISGDQITCSCCFFGFDFSVEMGMVDEDSGLISFVFVAE
jgi:hypothetical protein